MGLFDINFNLKVLEIAPPDKRKAVNIRWLQSLISPVQYLRDKFLGDYKTGSSYPQWVAGTYSKGAKVVYKQVVYESLIAGNTDAPPSANWALYLPSFLGVDERVLFNGVKLTLEYALNLRFLGTFRQPPAVSDIYITKVASTLVGFNVGQSIGSSVGQSTSSAAVGFTYPFLQIYNFRINIPAALYAQTNDNEIADFVRNFIPASLNFTIASY
jgi:hypothetical protein